MFKFSKIDLIFYFLKIIFRVNDKKILITTIPKSGTHLLTKYVELMCFKRSFGLGRNRPKQKKSKKRNKLKIEDVFKIVENKKNLILYGHIFDADPEIIDYFLKNFEIFIITRNPKEIICSFLNTIEREKDSHHYYEKIKNLNQEEKINQIMTQFPANYSDSIFSQIKKQDEFKKFSNCHFFKFEDLILNGPNKKFSTNYDRIAKILNLNFFSKHVSKLLILILGYNNKGSNFKHIKMFTNSNNILFDKLKKNII